MGQVLLSDRNVALLRLQGGDRIAVALHGRAAGVAGQDGVRLTGGAGPRGRAGRGGGAPTTCRGTPTPATWRVPLMKPGRRATPPEGEQLRHAGLRGALAVEVPLQYEICTAAAAGAWTHILQSPSPPPPLSPGGAQLLKGKADTAGKVGKGKQQPLGLRLPSTTPGSRGFAGHGRKTASATAMQQRAQAQAALGLEHGLSCSLRSGHAIYPPASWPQTYNLPICLLTADRHFLLPAWPRVAASAAQVDCDGFPPPGDSGSWMGRQIFGRRTGEAEVVDGDEHEAGDALLRRRLHHRYVRLPADLRRQRCGHSEETTRGCTAAGTPGADAASGT